MQRRQLTREEAVERARALAVPLREAAGRTEALRRLPDETAEQFLSTGLFGILQPARFGGSETGLSTFVEVGTELARGCPSSAWVYTVTESHFWILGMFPADAQDDVWKENPQTLACTSVAPSGQAQPMEGGYLLRGRWPFASGCDLAEWAILGSLVPPPREGELPTARWLLVPKQDYDIVDDWFVAGLRGTGSKSIRVEGAFVPEYRTVVVRDVMAGEGPGRAVNPGPLYRTPLAAAWPLTFMGPALGTALGAYDAWSEHIRSRTKVSMQTAQSEGAAAQLRLAESRAQVDAAQALVRRDVDEISRVVGDGQELTPLVRTRMRMHFAYVLRMCIDAVDRMFVASGGHALYEEHPMQRYWRDIQAMAHHRALDWDDVAETFARAELGLPPKGSFF